MPTHQQQNQKLARKLSRAKSPQQKLQCRNQLIEANIPLIYYLANKYFRQYPQFQEEIIAQGLVILVEKASTWDPKLGTFSAYITENFRHKGWELINSLSSPTGLSRRTQEKIRKGLLPRPKQIDGEEIIDLTTNPELIMISQEE